MSDNAQIEGVGRSNNNSTNSSSNTTMFPSPSSSSSEPAAIDTTPAGQPDLQVEEEAARLELEKQILANQVALLQKRLQEMYGGGSHVSKSLPSVPEDTPANLGTIEFRALGDNDDDDVHSLITFDQSANSGWTVKSSSVSQPRTLQPPSVPEEEEAEEGMEASSSPPLLGQFEPPLPERPYKSTATATATAKIWKSLAFLCTFLIPDACIRRNGSAAKQAWREKVTLCVLALLVSGVFVGGLGVLPVYSCRLSGMNEFKAWNEDNGSSTTTMTSIFGRLYETRLWANQHPGGPHQIAKAWGQDSSSYFARLSPSQLPAFCVDSNKNAYLSAHSQPTCGSTSSSFAVKDGNDDAQQQEQCHDSLVGIQAVHRRLGLYAKGFVELSPEILDTMQWIQIGRKVYNVTEYVQNLRAEGGGIVGVASHPNAYLYRPLHNMILQGLNQDATDIFDSLFNTPAMQEQCLDELFFVGHAPGPDDSLCGRAGAWIYLLFFLSAGIASVQALCTLMISFRDTPNFRDCDMKAGVLILVPCHDEGEQELRETFDSCLFTSYPSDSKILLVVADGDVTGPNETESTPQILSNILGFETQCGMEDLYAYPSLGSGPQAKNAANVYTGTYNTHMPNGATRSIQYIVVIKRGMPEEETGPAAGSRGKRDSQLILTGFLNRIHHNRQPNALDIALVRALFGFGLPVKDIDYLVMVDPSVRVDTRSISHMVYNMEQDGQALACGGEMLVDNKTESVLTMMQIFDFYSTQLVKRSFGSMFGCVSSLTPGFTMYRIYAEDMSCLVSDDCVHQAYARKDVNSLHEKTLYDDGKHHLLTTMLLQRFPTKKLLFLPEATSGVVIPNTLSMLFGHRRQRFVSLFHNSCEILQVRTGCCWSAMKISAILDLINSMISPALLGYMAFLTYVFVAHYESMDRIVLVLLGYAFGMQILSSLMHFRWGHLIWFPLFVVVGIPVLYVLVPIYSLVYMDDGSVPARPRRQLPPGDTVKATPPSGTVMIAGGISNLSMGDGGESSSSSRGARETGESNNHDSTRRLQRSSRASTRSRNPPCYEASVTEGSSSASDGAAQDGGATDAKLMQKEEPSFQIGEQIDL